MKNRGDLFKTNNSLNNGVVDCVYMPKLRLFTISILIILFVALSSVSIVKANVVKIDFSGVVDFVIDGDTFDVTLGNGTSFRVRMADVNAVELDEVGYAEAREYLKSLIYEKTVYLDVDDLYTYENHGSGNRLVCVTYLDFNSTHLMNVNEALSVAGHAKLRNYDNEFNPYNWDLYVPKEDVIPEFPSVILLFVTMILLMVCVSLTKSIVVKRNVA